MLVTFISRYKEKQFCQRNQAVLYAIPDTMKQEFSVEMVGGCKAEQMSVCRLSEPNKGYSLDYTDHILLSWLWTNQKIALKIFAAFLASTFLLLCLHQLILLFPRFQQNCFILTFSEGKGETTYVRWAVWQCPPPSATFRFMPGY